MAKVVYPMNLLRETKGTVRYQAVADDAAVTDVYVKKHALHNIRPKTITVSIEWDEKVT